MAISQPFNKFQYNHCEINICSEVFQLVHAILLLIELDSAEQIELANLLHCELFDHIIRFQCKYLITSENFELHKLLTRRIYQLLKKSSSLIQEQCFETLLINLLLDAANPYLNFLQNEIIFLFVRYLKLVKIKKDKCNEDNSSIITNNSVVQNHSGGELDVLFNKLNLAIDDDSSDQKHCNDTVREFLAKLYPNKLNDFNNHQLLKEFTRQLYKQKLLSN